MQLRTVNYIMFELFLVFCSLLIYLKVAIYDGQFNAKYMKSTLTLTAYRGLDNSQYMCRVGSLYSVYQLQVTCMLLNASFNASEIIPK